MLRRSVKTILATHRLDSRLRQVYVEGVDVVQFLGFVADLPAGSASQVRPIEKVEILDVREGGNRARVLSLARQVENAGVSIRGLVDADNDWLIPAPLPRNVWKTDGRDFESYFLSRDCFVKLGAVAGLDGAASDELLGRVLAIGRELGALRVVSVRQRLELPFQKTRLNRSLHASKSTLALDISRYVTTLLQNAKLSVEDVGSICAAVGDVLKEFATAPDVMLVSGKDALTIVDVALRALRCKVTAEALPMTFERSMVSDYAVLSEVVEYLRAAED